MEAKAKPTTLYLQNRSGSVKKWTHDPFGTIAVYIISISLLIIQVDCNRSISERKPINRQLSSENKQESQTSTILIILGAVLLLGVFFLIIWLITRKIRKPTVFSKGQTEEIPAGNTSKIAPQKFEANSAFEKALSQIAFQPTENLKKSITTNSDPLAEPTEILSHEFVKLNPNLAKTELDSGTEVKDLTSSQFNLVEGVNLRQNACDFADWGMRDTGDLSEQPAKLHKKKLFPAIEKKGDSKSDRQSTVSRFQVSGPRRMEGVQRAYADHF